MPTYTRKPMTLQDRIAEGLRRARRERSAAFHTLLFGKGLHDRESPDFDRA